MEDFLIRILSEFGYPVKLQGSLAAEEAYPDHFFTYWENEGEEKAHYDNGARANVYDYDVNFYSIDQTQAYEKLREAKRKLVEHGFIVPGNGHSVGSDEPSHTGRGIHVFYRANGKEGN